MILELKVLFMQLLDLDTPHRCVGAGKNVIFLFSAVKVNTTAANLLNSIPSLKLSATDVLRILHDAIYFNNETNIHHTNFVKQKIVMEDVLEKIKSNPDDMIKELYDITKSLATTDNVFIYLATDVNKLVKDHGSDLAILKELLNTTSEASDLTKRFQPKSEYFYRDTLKTKPQHIAFAVGGTESCYMKQSIPYDNTDWTNSSVR